jgi:hypothetical protein
METKRGLITASRVVSDPEPACASLGRDTRWAWSHVSEPPTCLVERRR